jgi:hypothetical protein
MAYVTGTANSLTDLLTALQAACTGNGWTLSGNVLHKGTCYADVSLGTSADSHHFPNAALKVRAGNGIDGSNALTDALTDTAGAMHMGPIPNRAVFTDWDWPVTYHIHVLSSPDEVYLLANYGSGQYWQNLCFGQSPAPGNAGTGNWVSAVMGADMSGELVPQSISIRPIGGIISGFNAFYVNCLPFFWGDSFSSNVVNALNSRMHGAIHSTTGAAIWTSGTSWLTNATFDEGQVSASRTVDPLLSYTPNAWNNETALLPIQILQGRLSAKVSLIGELQHSRFCRNDFIDDGALITLGSDRWKVYPAYRKDVVNRNGGDGITHSGTMAIAIRYDGP